MPICVVQSSDRFLWNCNLCVSYLHNISKWYHMYTILQLGTLQGQNAVKTLTHCFCARVFAQRSSESSSVGFSKYSICKRWAVCSRQILTYKHTWLIQLVHVAHTQNFQKEKNIGHIFLLRIVGEGYSQYFCNNTSVFLQQHFSIFAT